MGDTDQPRNKSAGFPVRYFFTGHHVIYNINIKQIGRSYVATGIKPGGLHADDEFQCILGAFAENQTVRLVFVQIPA